MQRAAVGRNDDIVVRHVDLEDQIFALRHTSQRRRDFAHDFLENDRLEMNSTFPRLDFRQIENVVDEGKQMPRARLHDP